MITIDWHLGLELVHDPQQVDDYTVNFTPWLGTETLANATVTSTGGLVAIVSAISPTGDVSYRLNGGTPGLPAQVTVRAISSSGRVLDRTIRYRVVDT